MSSGNDTIYQTEFENYIRMVMADTNAQITQSGVIAPSKTESFVSGSSNNLAGNAFINRWAELQPILRSWYTHIQMAWNKMMLTSFVNGKTIKVTRV
jgi:hypothetical protein